MRKTLLFLTILAMPFVFAKANNVAKVDAVSEWEVVAASGSNPWTQTEQGWVNTNTAWYAGNFLVNNNTTGKLYDEELDRLYLSATATFSGEHTTTELKTTQWRGIVLYYYDQNNWLTVGAKWYYSQNHSDRTNDEELTELSVLGKFNGQNYYVWHDTAWVNPEFQYKDLWTDGVDIRTTDTVTITASYTAAYDGSSQDDTDCVTVTVSNGVTSVTRSQNLRRPGANGYYSELATHAQTARSGIFSINCDHIMDDNVTFSNYQFMSNTPVISYDSSTYTNSAYVNSPVQVPTFSASTNVLGHPTINPTVKVYDPDDIEVSISSNTFIPTKIGTYKIKADAVDRSGKAAEQVVLDVDVTYATQINESGERPTSAYLNEEIILPTYSAVDDSSNPIPITVEVLDPDNEAVTVVDNKFIATKDGNYVVKVHSTDTSLPVNNIIYNISVTKFFYEIETNGEKIISGYVGDTIDLPTFSAKDRFNKNIPLTVEVTDPNNIKSTITAGSFKVTLDGYYTVRVLSASDKYFVNKITYTINILPKEGNTDVDPKVGTYGYGVSSYVVYVALFTSLAVVSGLTAGGIVFFRFRARRKK